MEVQCDGADEGGDAEGLRNGDRLATPPYPSNSAHPQAPSPAQKYWVGAVCGVEVVRGVGKQGSGEGLVGERGVCAARMLPKPVTLKGRSQKVARLQAS